MNRKLTKSTMKPQLQFTGHCMRKEGMEKTILMGKIAGTRQEGDIGSNFSKDLKN